METFLPHSSSHVKSSGSIEFKITALLADSKNMLMKIDF